jgi:hypothetical protein
MFIYNSTSGLWGVPRADNRALRYQTKEQWRSGGVSVAFGQQEVISTGHGSATHILGTPLS